VQVAVIAAVEIGGAPLRKVDRPPGAAAQLARIDDALQPGDILGSYEGWSENARGVFVKKPQAAQLFLDVADADRQHPGHGHVPVMGRLVGTGEKAAFVGEDGDVQAGHGGP